MRVVTENALEPDGYRIWARGELLDQGRIRPEARYCSEAALEFLPAGLRSADIPDPDLGLCQLPASAVNGRDGIAELLTMPPVEVVARCIGIVAKGLAEPQDLDA